MNTVFPQITSRKCSRCGRNLLLVGQVTETEEGQYGPIITSTYTCSNEECRKEFDRDLVKLLKSKEEKDLAHSKRMENLKKQRQITLEKKRANH